MAAKTMYVTVAGAGDKSGDTWLKAMGYAEWEADLEANVEAGDIYYVEEGTYTLTSTLDWNTRDGSSTAPICLIGVKSGTSNEPPILTDWATGSARPLIAGGANRVYAGDYCKIFNFQMTGTGTHGILFNPNGAGNNLKVSGSMSAGIRVSVACTLQGSEASTTGGYGIAMTGQCIAIFNYVHDCSADGFLASGNSAEILFNIIDTCAGDGIDLNQRNYARVVNNTIYNCGNGIAGTTSNSSTFINNIINDCTVGANWGTQEDNNFWLNNNLEGNGTPSINIATALPHSDFLLTAVDPQFTDDSGGDFSLLSGSGCIDAGLAITLGVS